MSRQKADTTPHNPDALVFTVEEVAAKLSIGVSTAYVAISRGDIPAIKIGGSVRVPKAELEKLLRPRRDVFGDRIGVSIDV